MARLVAQVLIALIVISLVMGVAAIMLLFLGQDWEDALLWILASLMIIAGLLVVTMKDIIRCGLAMIVCFGALAGIYVLMGAPLIGAAQVIVYIGAISVLILFAIMLTQEKVGSARLTFQTQSAPAAIASIVIAVLVAVVAYGTDWNAAAAPIRAATDYIAFRLFDHYILVLEAVGVLLLAAVIGGVFLAKREKDA